jgi:hypothetical protein
MSLDFLICKMRLCSNLHHPYITGVMMMVYEVRHKLSTLSLQFSTATNHLPGCYYHLQFPDEEQNQGLDSLLRIRELAAGGTQIDLPVCWSMQLGGLR